MSNTPESAARNRQMKSEYWSASCADVAAAVDREIALRAELDRIRSLEPAALACWGVPLGAGENRTTTKAADEGRSTLLPGEAMTPTLPPLPHWCEPGSPFAQQMQAYAAEAVRAAQAEQAKPLTDEQARQLCKVGPVYAPNGLVERTIQGYRRELEAAMLFGLRKGEEAHGIGPAGE